MNMFEIKNRWTGHVLFRSETAETIFGAVKEAVSGGAYLSGADLRDADLSDANLRGANLRGADLRGADLRDADLSDANLRGANLRGAYLSGADLSDADLRGANLRGANLRGADLSDADLSGADLRGANLSDANLSDAEVPIVENLDQKIVEAIDAGGKLDMSGWHFCDTTHCRAGWAIHLAGKDGMALESAFGPAVAGALIYHASTGRIPDFYAENEEAMDDIRECAAKQTGRTNVTE